MSACHCLPQVPERVRKDAQKKANKVKLVKSPVIKDSFGTIRLALRTYFIIFSVFSVQDCMCLMQIVSSPRVRRVRLYCEGKSRILIGSRLWSVGPSLNSSMHRPFKFMLYILPGHGNPSLLLGCVQRCMPKGRHQAWKVPQP